MERGLVLKKSGTESKVNKTAPVWNRSVSLEGSALGQDWKGWRGGDTVPYSVDPQVPIQIRVTQAILPNYPRRCSLGRYLDRWDMG